jgi:hypothetical protein
MSTLIRSCIQFLEETNDTHKAYFTFDADESGEYGVIKANKEGLRLYAAELLKKSLALEEIQDGKPIVIEQHVWLVSDAGYDLINEIIPQYRSREEILEVKSDGNPTPDKLHPGVTHQQTAKGCLASTWLWAGIILVSLIIVTAFRLFY